MLVFSYSLWTYPTTNIAQIDVYECFIDDVPLMRRCSDNWVNATQILKAAKFPKAHRTRILEREVQTGVHEKIQGGYGRFQGTWIPLDIARPLAHKYNITDDMAPILTYVADADNPVQRKSKGKQTSVEGSPLKKQKKVYNTKKRREAAAAAASAGGALPSPLSQHDKMPPPLAPAPDVKFWQQSEPPRFQLQHHQHQHQHQHQHHPQQHHSQYQQHHPQMAQFSTHAQMAQYQTQQAPPPQINFRNTPQGQQYQAPPTFAGMQQQHYQQHGSKSSNENWSQDDGSTQMDDVMRDSDTSVSSDGESDSKQGRSFYTDSLIQFFASDSTKIPQTLLHPPSDFDFNEPIDEEGHTPLHWAASMASVPLIELLLDNGADPLAPNATGLNAVSRAIFFNNSFQKRNFDLIAGLMKSCLYTPDKSGRTPLHYLCEGTRSKLDTAEYYLRSMLEQLTQGNKDLLKIVVKHADVNGDTALQLCYKAGNSALVDILDPYTREKKQSIDGMSEEKDDTIVQPSVPKMPLEEVGPMLTSMLGSLADAYDTELKNKEEESHHTKHVLDKLKQDLETTESQNREVLSQMDNGLSLEALLETIDGLETSCAQKSQHLGKIIERSQALVLAQAVLKEESAILPGSSKEDAIVLGVQLTRLQTDRAKTISTIKESLVAQNINKKMNDYRRLIALACGIKMESVDELIDEIEADLLTTVS